jgi:ubiquinone/menaquinone biosynthesis C-methylase UbiE
MPPFDEGQVKVYEEWLRSPAGYYIDGREKRLIGDLVAPQNGETLLDIGCKTGNHLLFFRRKGCDVSGIESSPHMLTIAKKKLGERAELYEGCGDDLPFSDNEFDIVTVASLGQAGNPRRVMREAFRVCRGRIFLGAFNRYALASAQRQKREPFYAHMNTPSACLSVYELFTMVKEIHQEYAPRWGSVISFPVGWYPFAAFFEEKIPMMRNPFGSFLGLVIPVTYTYITIQEPLRDRVTLTAGKEQREPVARETHR